MARIEETYPGPQSITEIKNALSPSRKMLFRLRGPSRDSRRETPVPRLPPARESAGPDTHGASLDAVALAKESGSSFGTPGNHYPRLGNELWSWLVLLADDARKVHGRFIAIGRTIRGNSKPRLCVC